MDTYRQKMDWTKLLAGGKWIIDKLKKVNPYILIIFFLFGVIGFQQMFPRKKYITKYETVLIHDTTYVTHTDTVVKNKIKTVFVYDTIYKDKIITVEKTPENMELVWTDYFSTKIITDTLANDTTLVAVIKYNINKNTLQSRDFSYQSRIKSTYTTNVTVINPLKTKVFATLEVGGNQFMMNDVPAYKFGIYGGLMLQTKKDLVFSVKYDPLNKGIYLGTAFKLFQYGKPKRN